MKKVIFSLMILCSIAILGSCKKTSYDDSKITYFVTLTINGDATTLVPVGTSYTEQGVVAMEGEKDVTSSVIIGGDTVDPTKIGLYKVTYEATNVDGFSSSASRTVIVYNPNVSTDISGAKKLQDGSHRLRLGTITPYAGYGINIDYIAPGIFYTNDFLGGWYWLRAAYGAKYACSGYFTLNEDNTLTMLSSSILPWGDTLDWFKNGVYDPATETTTWVVSYAGNMHFTVILK